MAKYEVLALSWIGNKLVQVGEIIEHLGDPGPNLKPVDKGAQKAASDAQLPEDLAKLVSALRMHAASRGVSPDEVNEFDFDAVQKILDPKPSMDLIKAAAAELKVTLGQSLA